MCMEMLLKSQDNEGICKSDNFIENIYGHVFMTFNDRVKMLQLIIKARRTLELSAELSVSRDCWRKLFPQVCGVIFCDFRHASHRRRIFNMLNYTRIWKAIAVLSDQTSFHLVLLSSYVVFPTLHVVL